MALVGDRNSLHGYGYAPFKMVVRRLLDNHALVLVCTSSDANWWQWIFGVGNLGRRLHSSVYGGGLVASGAPPSGCASTG